MQVSPIESLRLMCLLSITENGESQGPEVEELYLRDRKSHFERKRNVLTDRTFIPL